MRQLLTRRIGLTLVTLLLVSLIVFAVAQVIPGDIGRTILGPYSSNAQVARLDHQLGAAGPLPARYANWISGFVRGDWGTSYIYATPVRSLVLGRLLHSLELGAFGFVLIVPLSIMLGVFAARRNGGLADRTISITGMSLIAMPEFVLGVIVLVVFAVELGWLPVVSQVPSANPVDVVRQFLLPAIPMMFVLFGYISRMARAGTIEALEADFTRTAVLKGLPSRVVLWRHVLRNSLLPTVTVVAVQIGYLVGGLAVVETLFNYPGIGKLIIDSATNHDLPTLEACVLVISTLYVVVNLLADLTYGLLDPRIRVGGRS